MLHQATTLKYPSVRVRGVDRRGRPLSLRYIGFNEGLTYIEPYIRKKLFARVDTVSEVEQKSMDIALGERSGDGHDDLLILAAETAVIADIASEHAVDVLATRVHQVVTTSVGRAVVEGAMSRREVRRGKELRSSGFDFVVSHDDRDFYDFYRQMHRPTMQRRYGDAARSVDEDVAYRSLFKQGMLFLITHSGRPVAGSVSQLDLSKRRLNSRLIGVKDGDPGLTRNGSQNFVYHAILEWACLSSDMVGEVDFQGCEPFLSKGTFQYKKRFGTEVRIPDNIFGNYRMCLLARLDHLGVRDFLCENPALAVGVNGDISALYYFDSRHRARLDLPYLSPGIGSFRLVDLDET